MSEQPLSTNKRIGRYELLKQVDRGFLGPLWAARFDHQGTSLAALVRSVEPPPDLAPELWESLSDAAWTAIELQVPGVVHCADVVFQGTTLALVDDYVEGQPLSSLLRSKSNNDPAFPVGIALRVALDTLKALDELAAGCASLGVTSMHGGVSPDALLVGTDGMTRILNPLVSAAAAGDEYFRALPERAPYVSPEQWLQGTVDARTDVYAVGCILWELMTRKRLHAGSAANIRRCATSARLPAPLTDARASGLPAVVLELVQKAVAPQAADRYATLQGFADALQRCAIQLASAADVARFVENMASAPLEEQRAATENSTIAHLTDFFKAERPASVRPASPGVERAGAEQPKVKLALKLQPPNAKPAVSLAPKAKPAVSLPPRAAPALTKPAIPKSITPAAQPRLKSVAPLAQSAPSMSAGPNTAANVAGALKRVVAPVNAANDSGTVSATSARTHKSKANTTLLGISPPLAAVSPKEAPQRSAAIESREPSVYPGPNAITLAAGPLPHEIPYEEESLTIPYDDLLIARQMFADRTAAGRAASVGPTPQPANTQQVPAEPITGTRATAASTAAPASAVSAGPIASAPAPFAAAPGSVTVASAVTLEDSGQTVNLVELRNVAASSAPHVSSAAMFPSVTQAPSSAPQVSSGAAVSSGFALPAAAKKQWPAITWFFMGCTVSLSCVVLASVFRSSEAPLRATDVVNSQQPINPASTPAAQAERNEVAAVPAPPRVAAPPPEPAKATPETAPAVAASTSASPSLAVPPATATTPAPSGAGTSGAGTSGAGTSGAASGLPATAAPIAAAPPPVIRAPSRPRASTKPAPSSPSPRSSGRSKYVPKDL